MFHKQEVDGDNQSRILDASRVALESVVTELMDEKTSLHAVQNQLASSANDLKKSEDKVLADLNNGGEALEKLKNNLAAVNTNLQYLQTMTADQVKNLITANGALVSVASAARAQSLVAAKTLSVSKERFALSARQYTEAAAQAKARPELKFTIGYDYGDNRFLAAWNDVLLGKTILIPVGGEQALMFSLYYRNDGTGILKSANVVITDVTRSANFSQPYGVTCSVIDPHSVQCASIELPPGQSVERKFAIKTPPETTKLFTLVIGVVGETQSLRSYIARKTINVIITKGLDLHGRK